MTYRVRRGGAGVWCRAAATGVVLAVVVATAPATAYGAQQPNMPQMNMDHRGAMSGRVRNESGAAIAEAVVTAVNAANGAQFTATTDAQGAYSFAALPEGALLSALGPEIDESDIVVASNVQFRISYKGGDGNDVVLTADFPEIAVAADGRVATFTDVDGDIATIKTKIGQLDPRDFRLVRSGDVGGAQLALVDLRSGQSDVALRGTNLKITADRGPQGGLDALFAE